jgi:hypothetical protein
MPASAGKISAMALIPLSVAAMRSMLADVSFVPVLPSISLYGRIGREELTARSSSGAYHAYPTDKVLLGVV